MAHWYYFTDHPLITGIDVLVGQADVVVPNVEPGEYQILGKKSALLEKHCGQCLSAF